jgi:gluconate 2-dehydrogenase gamma chain
MTFFDAHQRATIEAAMARIIPTDDTPGAREARTIDFLDRYLSGIDYIYAKPDGSGFEVLEGRRADAWRQRIELLRERYVAGAEALDVTARARFGGADFATLEPERQDEVLRALETSSERAALQQTYAEVDLEFVPLLALHTRQGFYADPIYGGNHERTGWDVIGFPGPASLAEVHSGRYSTLSYFAGQEASR